MAKAKSRADVRRLNNRPAKPPQDESIERWLIELRRDLVVAHNLAIARIDFLVAKFVRDKCVRDRAIREKH